MKHARNQFLDLEAGGGGNDSESDEGEDDGMSACSGPSPYRIVGSLWHVPIEHVSHRYISLCQQRFIRVVKKCCQEKTKCLSLLVRPANHSKRG